MLGGVDWPLEAADDSDGEPCPSGRVRVNRSDGEVFAPERTAGPSPRADAGNTMVVMVVVVVAPGGVVCVATALASATFVSERGTSTTAKRVGDGGGVLSSDASEDANIDGPPPEANRGGGASVVAAPRAAVPCSSLGLATAVGTAGTNAGIDAACDTTSVGGSSNRSG